jgi:hypothetical protein
MNNMKLIMESWRKKLLKETDIESATEVTTTTADNVSPTERTIMDTASTISRNKKGIEQVLIPQGIPKTYVNMISIFNKDTKALKDAVEKKDATSMVKLGARVFDNAKSLEQLGFIKQGLADHAQILGAAGLALQSRDVFVKQGIPASIANVLTDGLYNKWSNNITSFRQQGINIVNSTQLMKNVYDSAEYAVKKYRQFYPATTAEGTATNFAARGIFSELLLPVGTVMLVTYYMTDYLIKTGAALERGNTAKFLNTRDIVVQKGASCENMKIERCPPQNLQRGIAAGKRQFNITDNWDQRTLVAMFVQQNKLNPQRDATEDYPYAFALVDQNFKGLVKSETKPETHGMEASAVGLAQQGQQGCLQRELAKITGPKTSLAISDAYKRCGLKQNMGFQST